MSTIGNRDFRPEYHVTPKQMWMNDPNGMFYQSGKWHLCYQYYPGAAHWGPMHWGHVVSTDLVNWEHLPVALKPDELGMIFSGSAIVDTENRSGLGQGGKPPVIAMYTSHGEWEQQSIAYSLDGVEFQTYAKNPVIPNQEQRDFRDPKLFWNEEKNCFQMVLAAGDHVEFYASENLLDWKKTGAFSAAGEWCQNAVWECPDLFPLKEETTGEQKWILFVSTGAVREPASEQKGSCTWYFIGTFDGERFLPEEETPGLLDFGYDNYAGVTWSGSQERVLIGWASNWLYANELPTGEFCGQMTFARRLALWQNGEKYELIQEPLLPEKKEAMPHMQEIELIAGQNISSEVFHISLKGVKAGEGIQLKNAKGQRLEIGVNGQSCVYVDRRQVLQEKEFDPIFASEKFGMAVAKRAVVKKAVAKKSSQLPEKENCNQKDNRNQLLHDLDVYWDHSILEVYADGGSAVITMLAYPEEPFSLVERMGTRVKLAVFDMDGLMFDTENLFFRYYQEEAEKLGFELTREFYIKTVGANAAAVRQITTELMGEEFPQEEAARNAHRRIDELLQVQQIPVKKGLRQLLEYFKEQGIVCAVASSSAGETIRKYLKSAGLEAYFTCLVNGNEVARSKPEPDIFLEACRRCGVKPEEALVLEDSQNGILAGWRAGIPVICVPDMKEPEPEYAEKTRLICEDLDEVLAVCKEMGYC